MERAVLGFDFGGTKIAIALSSEDGALLAENVLDTEPAAGARANLDRSVSAGRRLLEETAAPIELAAVCASTFGIPADDGVALAPAIPGWDSLPLRRLLRDCFSVPVAVLTDVKAAAVAEAASGALAGADPGLYLNLGTGLAAAIVVRGAVVMGAHGASGEIAYNLRSPDDLWGEAGPILEDVVSGRGLSAAAAGLAERTRDSSHRQELSANEVFARMPSEPAYADLVARFTRELAYHLVNLTIAVDPQVVAVGGGMVRSWDVLAPRLEAALTEHVPYPPQLVLGHFPHDAALRGALAEARSLAGAPHRATVTTP